MGVGSTRQSQVGTTEKKPEESFTRSMSQLLKKAYWEGQQAAANVVISSAEVPLMSHEERRS